MNVLRVALPGYDALTDTDPKHFSLRSDEDNVLIKEQTRGSVTVADGDTETIPHNLGYIPFYLVYGLIGSGRYRIVNSYNLYSDWRAYANETNLYIENQQSATYTTTKYFICLDNFT